MIAITRHLIGMENKGHPKIRVPFMFVIPEFKMTKVKRGRTRKGKNPIRVQKNRMDLIQTQVI